MNGPLEKEMEGMLPEDTELLFDTLLLVEILILAPGAELFGGRSMGTIGFAGPMPG